MNFRFKNKRERIAINDFSEYVIEYVSRPGMGLRKAEPWHERYLKLFHRLFHSMEQLWSGEMPPTGDKVLPSAPGEYVWSTEQ